MKTVATLAATLTLFAAPAFGQTGASSHAGVPAPTPKSPSFDRGATLSREAPQREAATLGREAPRLEVVIPAVPLSNTRPDLVLGLRGYGRPRASLRPADILSNLWEERRSAGGNGRGPSGDLADLYEDRRARVGEGGGSGR